MKKLVSTIVVIMLVASLFIGCSKNNENQNSDENNNNSSQQSDSKGNNENKGDNEDSKNDSEETLKLTWWHPLIAPNLNKSNDDILCYQEIQKNTNVDIEWVHPSAGATGNEQFNVMIASGDYPDIITQNWNVVEGGIAQALGGGVIIQLNDLMDKYAPNYLKLAKDNKSSMLDGGVRVGFHPIIIDKRQSAYKGLQIRKDWLDTLGLDTPKTIDDWYEVLTAFKNNDLNNNGEADEIPLGDSKNFALSGFSVAWGVYSDFYIHPDSNEVEYGPIQPEYKEYLTTMAKWYEEGLIDQEYAAIDNKVAEGKITGNKVGAYLSLLSRIQRFPAAGKEIDPNFEIIGASWPVGPAGVSYTAHDSLVNMVTNQTISITTDNKNPEKTVQFLDYIYSDEGIELINWGVEGETFEKVDGKNQYTDLVLNDTSKIFKYCHPNSGYNAPLDFEAIRSVLIPQQVDASLVWEDSDTSLLIEILSLTPEESAEMSTLMTEIKAYQNEKITKYIMGLEPITNFDEYVDQIKKMGIDDALKIKRDAYKRFQER